MTIATFFEICYTFFNERKVRSLFMGNEDSVLLTSSFLEELSTCVNSKLLSYRKGEFLSFFQNSKNQFALIKRGSISLKRTDEEGNVYLIEKYHKNDLFTKTWHKQEENELFFVCNTDVELILLDCSLLIKGCSSLCPRHTKIVEFFFQKVIAYTTFLNQKLALLQIKKMEDRILFFLKQHQNDQNQVELTLTYKELADYFMVDRSSFMRKLKELEEKKKIKKNGKIITILP